MTDFDDAIAWAREDTETFAGVVPDAWLQGRTAFGGLIAAIGLRALRVLVGDERPPLTVDTAFLAPLGPGPARATVSILRAGRHVTQAEARITQEGGERARVSAVFGQARPSALALAGELAAPRCAPAEAIDFTGNARRGRAEARPVPKNIPRFTENVDLLWCEGSPPFSGSREAVTGGYCRHRTRASGVEALLALLDAWPAPTLALAPGPLVASSVRWVAHVVSDMSVEPGEWCWLRSHAVHAGGGYTTMIARLHGPDGRLRLWGEQLVAIFE